MWVVKARVWYKIT